MMMHTAPITSRTIPMTKKMIECKSLPMSGYPWNLFNDLGGGI